MEEEKIRKDANGNIINKSNKKNYHITMIENLVTRIEVESYKQYNIFIRNHDTSYRVNLFIGRKL